MLSGLLCEVTAFSLRLLGALEALLDSVNLLVRLVEVEFRFFLCSICLVQAVAENAHPPRSLAIVREEAAGRGRT